MAVNLSPVGGVAAQFFTNTGAVLTGGKLYTYAAGTTTPVVTYTTSQGNVAWTNPVQLDAAGRVPNSGEIWLTDGVIYKFVLKDSNDVLIATYDNITGINSNAVAYTNSQEIFTATSGQTVFTLTTAYAPGTNSLSVFVDGVNQYGPGAQYAYVETDQYTVTFNNGLHVGAEVKFTTTQQQGAGAVDASQVSYNPPFTASVTTNVENKLAQTVSVKDFGAVGDGITDDAAAIQTAVEYAFANGFDLIADGSTYAVGSTILIPQNSPAPTFETAKKITLDFKDSIFKLLADTPLFESAYDNAGTLTSNYGTPLDSHYSAGITLTNFGVESDVGQLTQPTLKIQDWHQQCQLTNISSGVSQQMLWANNCFYMTVDNIQASIIAPKAGDRFIWFNNTNLCKISRLVAGNSITGYRFDGPVTATVLQNMSFEGQTTGALFNATVYDVAIRDSYFEAWSDVAVAFDSYVLGATLDNNYINFGNNATAYLLYYNPLPGANVVVSPSNYFESMPSNANIIKVAENNYGGAIRIDRPTEASTSINDLLVNNSIIGSRIDWRQRKRGTNYLANVVNEYAVGNYSGKYTDGYNNQNGFAWVNLSNTTLKISTKITQNFVQLIYVNIQVNFSGGPTTLAGLFIGNQFYKATGGSFAPSSDLAATTDVNGYVQIDGGYSFAATITSVVGEIRLI